MYPDRITDSFSLRSYYEFGRRSFWWFLFDLIVGSGQGSTCFGPNFSFMLSREDLQVNKEKPLACVAQGFLICFPVKNRVPNP